MPLIKLCFPSRVFFITHHQTDYNHLQNRNNKESTKNTKRLKKKLNAHHLQYYKINKGYTQLILVFGTKEIIDPNHSERLLRSSKPRCLQFRWIYRYMQWAWFPLKFFCAYMHTITCNLVRK